MAPKDRQVQNDPSSRASRKGRTFRDLRASDSQITAEQLIAQAQELQQLTGLSTKEPSRILLMSATELALYRQTTRNEFETNVRRSFIDFGSWVRYAKWEEEQGDIVRARAVFDRALQYHGERKEYWRQYAEVEQRLGTAERARSILARATTSLPQCTELWLMYVALEQTTHRDHHVRQVFQQWIRTQPPPFVWRLAVQYECYRRQQEEDQGGLHEARIRELLQDFVVKHNDAASWSYYAGIELRLLCNPSRSIEVLQTALQALPGAETEVSIQLLLGEALKAKGETAAARNVYVRLLDFASKDARCPPEARETIFQAFAAFKRSARCSNSSDGSDGGHDDAMVCAQARLRYRFDVDRAAGSGGNAFEAAASLAALEHTPADTRKILQEGSTLAPKTDSDFQQRTAIVMKLARLMRAGEPEAAKTLLFETLKSFPHKHIQNAALWTECCRAVLACGGEDAQSTVRTVLGQALGLCPDDALYEFYITLELTHLRSEDSLARVREVYKAWLDRFPMHVVAWAKFAAFEAQQGENERSDGILKMGIDLLTRAARQADSWRQRYQHMESIDSLWKERLRLSITSARGDGDAHTRGVYESLALSCATMYMESFDMWRQEELSRRMKATETSGTTAPVVATAPQQLPAELQPAIRRMHAALVGRMGFERRTSKDAVEVLRGSLLAMVEARRAASRELLAARSDFQDVVAERSWVELSLSPLFHTWRQLESEYGTKESLAAIAQTAEPPKKKARLFKV